MEHHTQKMKAGLYFAIKNVSQTIESSENIKIDSKVSAALTETVYSYLENLSRDLELFAK